MSLNHLYCCIWAFHLVDFGNCWSLYQRSKIHIVIIVSVALSVWSTDVLFEQFIDLEVFLSLKCKKDDRNNVFD